LLEDEARKIKWFFINYELQSYYTCKIK
jgi:hypothetical protein